MKDISFHLQELTEELTGVQNKIQTVIRMLQAAQNENISTEDEKTLTAVEEGKKYADLKEEGYFVSEIATMSGKSSQFVRDRIALWNSDPMVKEASKGRDEGGIGLSAAIGIARLRKDHEDQRELVRQAQKSPKERRAVLERLRLVLQKPQTS